MEGREEDRKEMHIFHRVERAQRMHLCHMRWQRNNHLCRKLFDVLVVPVHAVVIFCRRRCGVVRGACGGSLFNFLTLNFDTHHHHSRSYAPGTTEEGKKGQSKKRAGNPPSTSPL